MCEVLDRIEKRGEQRGLEQGIKQMIVRMYKNGYSIKQISRVAEMSEKSIQEMVEQFLANKGIFCKNAVFG